MPETKDLLERAHARALGTLSDTDAFETFASYRDRRRRNRRIASASVALLLVVAVAGAAAVLREGEGGSTLGSIANEDGPCFPADPCWDLDVYVMRADGSETTRLGGGTTRDIVWDWSPDGRSIAYAAADGVPGDPATDLTADIVTIAPDGSLVTRLTTTPETELFPTYSPDGASIAYTQEGSVHDIGVMGSDGSDPVPVTAGDDDDGLDDYHPTWSPDGERIAYIRGHIPNGGPGALMAISVDGGVAEVLYDATPVEWPDWSPDGSKIAFNVGTWPDVEVQVLDLGTGEVTAYGSGYLPRWSPDGSKLLVASPDGGFGVLDLANARMQILSRTAWANASWSPDGEWVAFSDAAPDGRGGSTVYHPAPLGEVWAGSLDDGTPIVAVTHDDGTVTVVEAISPHLATGNIRKMLGWCESSRTFDDPFHGARFDEYGNYISGPSPSGLVTFVTAPVEGTPGSFTIGDQRPVIAKGIYENPAGPFCEDGTSLIRPSSADLAATDPDAPDTPASLIGLEPTPPFGSRWEVEGTLLLLPDGRSFLCDRVDGEECLDGAPVEGPAIEGGDALVVPGRWFVLVGDGAFVDPIRVG